VAGGDVALICNGEYEDTSQVLGAIDLINMENFIDLFV
jgi:hypothetical protein